MKNANSTVKSLRQARGIGWFDLPARGNAGGIIISWRDNILDLVRVVKGNTSMSIIWCFIAFYGEGKENERDLLWNDHEPVK